jgi:RNA polymerase sigma-70 factor, ECF subfamily
MSPWQHLLAQLPAERRDALAGRADLGAKLIEWLQDRAERLGPWPITESDMLSSLARAIEDIADDELLALHAVDLVHARCCQRGDHGALKQFDTAYGPDLDRAIAKSPNLGVTAEEFRQLVRGRLFVADGAPPRIASYRGSGALRSWVRVMASRLVVDLSRRHDDRTRLDDDLAKRIGQAGDHELGLLRHAYGEALAPAFERALTGLTPRQRNLLRQRFLHAVTVERLAQSYDVHRSTVFDWLDKARSALLRGVRHELAETIPGEKLDSVVALLGSDLHISVQRMLDDQLEREA